MKVSTVLVYIALGATSARALPTEVVDDAVANIDNFDIDEVVGNFAGDLDARDITEVDDVEEFVDFDARDITEADFDVDEIVEGELDARDVTEADFDVDDTVEGELDARANLPGLTATQSKYARAIIGQAKKDKVGAHGCQAAIATALTESSLIMYANKAVPASMKLPHDRVGSDHDSVGLFQQRASIYKNVKCDMGAACSAGQFFTEMKRVKGWQSMAVGKLCQRVQRSAYPDRYNKFVSTATKACKAGGL